MRHGVSQRWDWGLPRPSWWAGLVGGGQVLRCVVCMQAAEKQMKDKQDEEQRLKEEEEDKKRKQEEEADKEDEEDKDEDEEDEEDKDEEEEEDAAGQAKDEL